MTLAWAGGATAASNKATTWVTTKGKTVNLTLIGAYNNNLGGFNFNGAGKGQMTVTVPRNSIVHVTFKNNASLPHSAQIVAFSSTPPASAVSDAFKGANTPNPTSGSAKGVTQKFTFMATKTGKYLLICAVPGHAAAGMWDNFVVSSSAKTASAVIKM
jgi:sulfocyanin